MKQKIYIILPLIFILLIMPVYAQNELLTNLTHYFSFDNNNFTNKISPPAHQSLNNNGSINTTGILGDARYCDGSTFMEAQYVKDINGARTINFWYQSIGTSQGILLGTYDSGNNWFEVDIDDIPTGQIEWDIGKYSLGQYQYSRFNNSIAFDGNWHMLTLLKPDNDVANYKVYLDGVEQSIDAGYYHTDIITNITLATTFQLCGRGGITSQHLTNMTIDEWAEWDTALNQTQIDDLYNSGSGLPFENFTGTPYIPLNCTENWNCSSYNTQICRNDSKRECYAVTDLNTCGTNFTGNLHDYDVACTYIPLDPDNDLKIGLSYFFPYDNNNLSSSTGTGNQTNNGTTSITGKLGDARYCDGTTNLMNNFDLSNEFANDFSINFWYKAPMTQEFNPSYSYAGVEMMGYWNAINGDWVEVDWEVDHCCYYPHNSFLMGWGDTTPTATEMYITKPTEMFDNQWHMLTITKTGSSANTMNIYLDGILQNGDASYYNRYGDIASVSQLNWSICARTINAPVGGGVRYTNMSIDELGFWDKELTQNDVNQLYFNGEGITYTNFTGEINCTENWTCDIYSACLPNNTMPCTSVVDTNFCGENFTGNIGDYDTSCIYNSTNPPINTTGNDFTSASFDTGVKLIRGFGAIAILFGIALASIGIAYVVRKLIIKKP